MKGKSLTIADTDLRDILKIDKETRSGQYICTCPYCGKPAHFYINRKTQLWDCKKCGTAGNIYKLLIHLDKTYLIGDKSVEFTEKISSIRSLSNSEDVSEDVKELPEKKMPFGYRVDLSNKYLKSRGVTRETIKYFKLGVCNLSSKLKNYILFPIYDGGKIRGYLGRYGAKRIPDGKLRYSNSIGTDFAQLLYGFDDIIKDKTRTVIITEGVFDKFSCDQNLGLYDIDDIKCVSTFGKKISKYQIDKLLQKHVKNIIISWDFDALKEIKKFGNELKYYFNVYVCITRKEKDLGDCTKEELLEVFSNPIDIDSFSLDIIGKVKK